MAESGQITADVLTNAIFKGAADVDTEFAKMNRTVGQAGTVLANTLGSLVNDANKSSGATNGLSTAIVDLATTIDRNRDAILSLFANIVEAAQWAIERITNLSRTIRGIGMVKAGKLDLLEFAGMGPEDLEKWFSSFDSGTQKITSRLQSARAELAAMREGGNADRRQGLYQEIRELEFALEQAKEVAAAKKAAANNVKPVFSGGSVVPFSPTATKPASSAAAAERALNAEIAAGLRFREAQAELNADVFAEQVARLDRERQQYITTWADKAKTAEEKEKRITEIAAWYAASRAEIEQQAAQKAANDRRALLESGVALKEAELARQVAAGTITATEALAAQVDLLRQRQAILQEHLATMPKATAEDITAYNTQAAALAGVNAELAVTGTRLRLTNSFEALKQGLADIANSSAESGEAIRSALQSAFSGLDNTVANFVTGTKASFGDMVNSILADLARIASQKLISQPLAAGLSGMLSGISLNARGGVYRSVGLSAYSNSIVNQPTVFPFARGIGLMGEAGPEAILPLKRGPGGRLGVEASGSGGVVVNVIEAPGKGGQQQRRSDGGVNVVDVFVEQIKQSVATDIVRGSGQIPAALSWTYGLNRAAGAY
jgi:lambda family phage tail tape measure protein